MDRWKLPDDTGVLQARIELVMRDLMPVAKFGPYPDEYYNIATTQCEVIEAAFPLLDCYCVLSALLHIVLSALLHIS